MTGSQHCYYPSSITYTADTTGTKGNGAGGQTTLADWTASFPVLPAAAGAAGAGGEAKAKGGGGGSASTECDGELLSQADWEGSTYCDEAQAGKVYTP